ncbi:hypothetical protein, partial [Nonomuraea thailandensis]|uniref:hypothetical protein n=1 Tax=Nonomuraea thailandensis TaxID=1188745 RepID=UPI003611D19D
GRPEASALRIEAYPADPASCRATGGTAGDPGACDTAPAAGRGPGAVVIEKRHTTLVVGFG